MCDLLTCKGIFNFLFLPKEIKFLDVLHFMCLLAKEITAILHYRQQAGTGQIMLLLLE